jgi:hypothetical protein
MYLYCVVILTASACTAAPTTHRCGPLLNIKKVFTTYTLPVSPGHQILKYCTPIVEISRPPTPRAYIDNALLQPKVEVLATTTSEQVGAEHSGIDSNINEVAGKAPEE